MPAPVSTEGTGAVCERFFGWPFLAAQIFARCDEAEAEDEAAGDAQAGAEKSLFDRIFDQQKRAKRQRDAADDHRPMRAKPLFDADFSAGCRDRQRQGFGGGRFGCWRGRRFFRLLRFFRRHAR